MAPASHLAYSVAPRRSILSGQGRRLHVNRTVATGPVRALRASLALGIVDPLLVRAPHHSFGHRNRAHLMASKKQGNLLECCRIVPDVAALGEPPPQRDRFGVRCNDDGDSHLAGELSVRSIEGDGADWVATKAQFALFI